LVDFIGNVGFDFSGRFGYALGEGADVGVAAVGNDNI